MKPFLPIFFLLAFFTSAYIAHANTFYTPEGAIVNINIENKTKPGQPYEQGHKIKVSGFLSSYAPMRVTMDAITIGNDRVELLPSAGIEITTQIAGVPLLLTEKDFTVSLPQGTQLPYTANVDVRVGVVVPSVQLGFAFCRSGGTCNDNASCSVRYTVVAQNAPADATIRIIKTNSSSANVSPHIASLPAPTIEYNEPNGFASAVQYELSLVDSFNVVLATNTGTLSHQSAWTYFPQCQ